MGMTFRPPASAAPAHFDLSRPSAAPLEESFRAMVRQVLSVGTFHGSLDYDGDFETSYAQNDVQVATHGISNTTCLLKDSSAELNVPGVSAGKVVRQVLDPVLSEVFQECPCWQLDRQKRDVWHGRIDLADGLSVIIGCAPGTASEGSEVPMACATIEVAEIN